MAAQGFDSVYGPGMLASNMALAGMAFAVALKAQQPSYRAYSISSGATATLGVAQPALYGIATVLRRPFLAVMAGGASGGVDELRVNPMGDTLDQELAGLGQLLDLVSDVNAERAVGGA